MNDRVLMNNIWEESIEAVSRNILTETFKDAIIRALEITNIIDQNKYHVQPEVYDGYYNGNILLGMTSEDFNEITKRL